MSISAIGGAQYAQFRPPAGMQQQADKALSKTADLLGMSTDALKSQLQAGKTLAGIADEKGVSRADLLDSIKQGLQAAAPQGVQAPSGTQLDKIAGDLADGNRPGRGGMPPVGPPPSGAPGSGQNLSSLADSLGMEVSSLLQQLGSDDDSSSSFTSMLSRSSQAYGSSISSQQLQGLRVDVVA